MSDHDQLPPISELWPLLRVNFEKRLMAMASKMRKEGEDYSAIGIAISSCNRLLDEVERDYITPPETNRSRRPKLKT